MADAAALVWFRRDLRLADNRALRAGAARGPVLPVFIWAPEEEAPWEPGGASHWWLQWAEGIRAAWKPGEAAAHAQLKRFLNCALSNYDADRNRPDLVGTSRLSPHLHSGEISPRQIWHAVRRHAEARNIPERTWRAGQWAAGAPAYLPAYTVQPP